MANKGEWTPIENAKIIGILPEYRNSKKIGSPGNHDRSASRVCANRLINNDPLGIFTPRINRVQNHVDTIAAHIERMDNIASGFKDPEFADEFNWKNCYRY